MTNLYPINKITIIPLREHVYNYLKRQILTNQYWPGQTIVTDQLAKELNISHTPIREALMLLEKEGLIITGRYTSVKVTLIEAVDIRNIYQVRIVLESWAAGEAARLMTDAEIDIIKQKFEAIQAEGDQVSREKYLEWDISFHELINQAAKNQTYDRIMELISDQSERIRSLVEAFRSWEWEQTIISEHRAILQAIQESKPELAQERMVYHLEAAMQRSLAALDKIPLNNPNSE